MEVGLRVPSAEALRYVGQGLPGLVRNAEDEILAGVPVETR
jgi:hypothetical protein